MTRKLVLCLSLYLLGTAAVHAGTVYLPLSGYELVGSKGWEPVAFVTNGSSVAGEFKQLLLHADTDGTTRPPNPTAQQVAAGESAGLALSPTFEGLLELSGPAGFSFSGRLDRTDGSDSVELPILSSETAAAAGSTLYLQGLRRGTTLATDWTIVNLGWTAANCSISAFSVDGGPIGPAATVTVKPLSTRVFADVLQILGLAAADYVRGQVSCDQMFYSFAMARDAENGDIGLIEPSGRGNSGLVLPGEGGNFSCPAGAACFEAKGLAFKPTENEPTKGFNFAVPPGTYERIHFEMDVKHGGWNAEKPSGKHMLFWLVKNRNYYMYGYSNFEGPSKNNVFFRHGVGLTHPEKIKLSDSFAAQPGHTYHLDYTYDTRENFLSLVISENGAEVASIHGQPNVNAIDFAGGDEGVLGIGFDGSNPAERPTYGWEYRDIKIQWLK